jgi:peptidoglycan glycosyltransferase
VRRSAISADRRLELTLLILAAVTCTLGLALLALSMGQSPLRALRVTAVGGAFIVAHFVLQDNSRSRDRLLLPLASLLSGIGIMILWRINAELASKQVIWMLLGIAAMIVVYYLLEDVRDLAQYTYIAGVCALLLLVGTMIFGREINGARLWLGIEGVFQFQPGELAKVLMCLFFAGYVAAKGPIIRRQVSDRPGVTFPGLKYVGPLLLVVLFCLAVFVLQRDLGAAVLFFGLFVAVTYLATGRKTYALLSVVFFVAGMIGAYQIFPHVRIRFEAWLNPWQDPGGSGYQILQGLYALANGGLSGVGLGQGFPQLLPAAATDMIYAVIGEELGLLGTVAVVLLYVLVVTRSFSLGWRAHHDYGGLLATCLAVVFGLQTLIIIGGVLRLIPLTGITMPFVSYGGTSVVVNFVALGLLLAISRDCVKSEQPLPEGR